MPRIDYLPDDPIFMAMDATLAPYASVAFRRLIDAIDPVADQDVATKKYVDDNIGGGGNFMADGSVPATGAFDMGTNVITNMADPTNPQDAATKAYADALSFAAGMTQEQILSRISLGA